MNFEAFDVPNNYLTERHCDFEQYNIVWKKKEYTIYRSGWFPEESTNSEVNVCFVVSEETEGNCKVVDKQTVCNCHPYSKGCMISILNAILVGKQPKYLYRSNELVTERIISFGDICVYRDYLWNVRDRSSFMSADDYHSVSMFCCNKTHFGFSILNDITAILGGHSKIGRVLPCVKELNDTSVDASCWQKLDREGRVHTPFWPDVRSDLMSVLHRGKWINFLPITRIRVDAMIDNTNLSPSDKGKIIKITSAAQSNCTRCYQDSCVWDVNGEKIVSTVNLLKGGVWNSFYTNRQRRICGMQLANLAIACEGRSFGFAMKPDCVEIGLQKIWPDL